MKAALIILIVILLGVVELMAQSGSHMVLEVHNDIGESIDLHEKNKYKILTFIPSENFDSAQFRMKEDSSISIHIWKSNKSTESRVSSYYQYESTVKVVKEYYYTYQDKSIRIYEIVLKDGTRLKGEIVSEDEKSIVFQSESLGEMTLKKSEIKSKKELDQSELNGGNEWFDNPHATRYFFGPSAFTLEKGDGYYQNAMLILNSFNVGITDHISIGGGLELISTFASGSDGPIYFLTPKIGYEVAEKVNLGGGLLFAGLMGSNAGIMYGVGTFGSIEHNVSIGGGYGFIDSEMTELPIITISGMTRIAPRTSLVTESWIIPFEKTERSYINGIYRTEIIGYEYNAFISYGVRFFGEKISVDLGFVNNKDIASSFLIIGIPYVDFVVKFK